jgi:hypothetical protein
MHSAMESFEHGAHVDTEGLPADIAVADARVSGFALQCATALLHWSERTLSIIAVHSIQNPNQGRPFGKHKIVKGSQPLP